MTLEKEIDYISEQAIGILASVRDFKKHKNLNKELSSLMEKSNNIQNILNNIKNYLGR